MPTLQKLGSALARVNMPNPVELLDRTFVFITEGHTYFLAGKITGCELYQGLPDYIVRLYIINPAFNFGSFTPYYLINEEGKWFLVFEMDYPRSKEKRRLNKLAGKLFVLGFRRNEFAPFINLIDKSGLPCDPAQIIGRAVAVRIKESGQELISIITGMESELVGQKQSDGQIALYIQMPLLRDTVIQYLLFTTNPKGWHISHIENKTLLLREPNLSILPEESDVEIELVE